MTTPRTAIVTGASSGIGRAIACELGGLGWRVALGARRTDRLDDAAAEVRDAGGEAFTRYLDVADASSIAGFFAAAETALGGVDALVNNAGVAAPGWLEQVSVEAIEREIATNLLGPVLASRLAVASMRARQSGGDLVFITSDATRHPRPRMATYTATKAALEALAQALALELEGSGIRATTVRVGPTLSEFGFGWPMDDLEDLMGYWPRFGLQRHAGVLDVSAVAQAVVAALTAPPGVHVEMIEVQPAAPVDDPGPARIVERPTAR
jgi:NAD(P)-dependent dehydrogenase (short-subunit alcohol dehydrogenase family)